MGTGSFGGGSSGALGRSGSGARFSSRPPSVGPADATTSFFASRNSGKPPSEAAARAIVRDSFAQRQVGDYLVGLVASSAVQGCFEELFLISVLLRQQRSWDAISQKYGVPDRPGCLADLAAAVRRKHSGNEDIEAFREIAASVVDDILLAAVGDDDDIYLSGRAKDVFDAVQRYGSKVFSSLSGHYFGSLLNRAAVRELPALNEHEKQMIRIATQERADFVILGFEHSFASKQQITHRQLLRSLVEHADWFQDKLRKDLEP